MGTNQQLLLTGPGHTARLGLCPGLRIKTPIAQTLPRLCTALQLAGHGLDPDCPPYIFTDDFKSFHSDLLICFIFLFGKTQQYRLEGRGSQFQKLSGVQENLSYQLRGTAPGELPSSKAVVCFRKLPCHPEIQLFEKEENKIKPNKLLAVLKGEFIF